MKADPWLITAQEILDGKWNKADDSTIESLRIGLRSNTNEVSKSAMTALEKLKRKGKPANEPY